MPDPSPPRIAPPHGEATAAGQPVAGDPITAVDTRPPTAATTHDPRLRRRQVAALLAPPLLITSTYLMFQALVTLWGERWGYLGGFLFFWLFWCAGFSFWALGVGGIKAVLRDARPRLPRPQILWLVLLAVPVAGGFATVLLPDFPRATVAVLALAWFIAVVNASLEELFWRGVYIRLFPGRLITGWLYPAALFALWHIAPTSVRGSATVLVSSAAYLGLVYGWVACRTGTIRYTIPAHILLNAMGLTFALTLLGQ